MLYWTCWVCDKMMEETPSERMRRQFKGACTGCGYKRDSSCRWLWEREWHGCDDYCDYVPNVLRMELGSEDEALNAVSYARETKDFGKLEELDWRHHRHLEGCESGDEEYEEELVRQVSSS